VYPEILKLLRASALNKTGHKKVEMLAFRSPYLRKGER